MHERAFTLYPNIARFTPPQPQPLFLAYKATAAPSARLRHEVEIYTDGSCLNNGQPNAKAGHGVFYGHSDTRNCSDQILGPTQTSGLGELVAVAVAVDSISKLSQFDTYYILTDSTYLYDALRVHHYSWRNNNWMTVEESPVKHKGLLMHVLDELEFLRICGYRVYLEKCESHPRGGPGNAQADAFACLGSSGRSKYTYDPVNFTQKETSALTVTAYVQGCNVGSMWAGAACFMVKRPRNLCKRTRGRLRGNIVELAAIDQALKSVLTTSNRPSKIVMGSNCANNCFTKCHSELPERGWRNLLLYSKRKQRLFRRINRHLLDFNREGINVHWTNTPEGGSNVSALAKAKAKREAADVAWRRVDFDYFYV